MTTRLLLCVLGALWLPTGVARAQSHEIVEIPHAPDRPQLEILLATNGDDGGTLSLPSESPHAVAIDGFRQREPGDGTPVSRSTHAYLYYDDEHLYVDFVCEDDPRAVRAHMAPREQIDADDQVWVYLDTFHDRQRAYIFAANPLGVQLDGVKSEGQDDDFGFDTVWESEGRLTPNGYVVRFTIPFKSLRFRNDSVQNWGIALGRVIRRNNEEAYWPYITKRVEGFVQQFATAQGMRRISPGRNVQVIGYSTLARAREFDDDLPAGPDFVREDDWRGGLDAKAVLRDAVTLDFAANPDFSQVESDDPQVTINERFDVFFPEKRPFFIENASYFQTPTNLFHSRNIADPQAGLRLTGKMGGWTVGALAIDDREPGRDVDEDDPRFNERSFIGVASVRREFGEGSSLGAMLTSRDFGESSNRIASVHGRWRLGSNWVAQGQAMRSFTRSLEGERTPGMGYLAELGYDGRNLELQWKYTDLHPDFRSDLGFIERVDIRRGEFEGAYQWKPDGDVLQSWGPVAAALVNWDHAGIMQDWEIQAGVEMELTRGTEIQLEREEAMERFEGREFRRYENTIELGTEWWDWLALAAEYKWGAEPNFDPVDELEPFLGNFIESEVGFTLRPWPNLRLGQTYIYERLNTRADTALVGVAPGSRVFSTHVLRTKLNYQFTRALSLRLILDYETVSADEALIDEDDNEKELTGDILLTYLVNPGTAIYLGYTDQYENFVLEREPERRVRRVNGLRTSDGRQVFLKVTYLFRF